MPHVIVNLYLLHTVATAVLTAVASMFVSFVSDMKMASVSNFAITTVAVALLAGSKFIISGSVASPVLRPARIPKMNAWLLSHALLAWSILILLVFVNAMAAAIMGVAIPLFWLNAWKSGQRESRLWQFVEGGYFALPAIVGGAAIAQQIQMPALIVAILMLQWAMVYAQANMLSRAVDGASKSAAAPRISVGVRADWQLALRLAQLAVWTLLPAILFPLVMVEQRLGIMYLIVAFGLAVSLVVIGFEPVLGVGRLRQRRLVAVFNLYPLLLMPALILDRLP